ncbi:aminotransferase class I/II-fold pyridoxal phosphate-dependent enzyme [Geomicrobium sp. JSM 1781026]|uniref:methionine gamma-lyase family protein n=1 Tax=Geomicrobium sp. JSM 1781026 TaxID=3344580 RepID=UPI0035BF9BD1
MTDQIQTWEREINIDLSDIYTQIDQTSERNVAKVLDAFQEAGISKHHLVGSDGYGYDDEGREKLEQVYAQIFGMERALVRPHFVSGTHAISAALFGNMRPGEQLVYASGDPYETMQSVLGLTGDEVGNFKEYNMDTHVVPLKEGRIDLSCVTAAISEKTSWVVIQRSSGYDSRPSITLDELGAYILHIKTHHPHVNVFVDNCYGEFVETEEPGDVGADLIAGSLIKNPGGGIAKTGGYIAGKARFVERAASRLSAPGIGIEAGATGPFLHDAFLGVFMASTVVADAVKGAHFTAAMLEKAGFHTTPSSMTKRTDLIQAVHFGEERAMVSFCQSIQQNSPVDARALPVPGPLPGYDGNVIMAAGTFVQGASIELSADGPVAEPYTAYVQGGLSFAHVKIAVKRALATMLHHSCQKS